METGTRNSGLNPKRAAGDGQAFPVKKAEAFHLKSRAGVLSYNDECDQDISTLKCPEKMI